MADLGGRGLGLSDTDREAEAIQLQLLRDKSPSERFATALRLSSELVHAFKAAIRRTHPEYNEVDIGLMFVELQYGKKLAAELRCFQERRRSDEMADHG